MFDKGQIAGLMKKAQEMQSNMQKAQDELAKVEIEGESGAGMVKIIIAGNHYVKKVTIEPSLMDDREMLEDLIAAAVNDATRKIEEHTSAKMGGLTAGMPGLGDFKLPF